MEGCSHHTGLPVYDEPFPLGGKRRILRAMEVYRRETYSIIHLFLRERITFPKCISALEEALANLVKRGGHTKLSELRALMIANNAVVTKEMERRGPRLN